MHPRAKKERERKRERKKERKKEEFLRLKMKNSLNAVRFFFLTSFRSLATLLPSGSRGLSRCPKNLFGV